MIFSSFATDLVELHDGPLQRHVVLVEVVGSDFAASGLDALAPEVALGILEPGKQTLNSYKFSSS